MATQEHGAIRSKRPDILDNAFRNSIDLLVQNMALKGGDTKIPVRTRPGIDFVTIASAGEGEERKTIELYASGWWGSTAEKGIPIAIGRVRDTDPDTILELYAMIKDPGLTESILRGISVSVDELVGKKKPKRKQEAIMVEQIQPIVDRYLERNRQRLMRGFMQDMKSAFQRVLGRSLN